MVVQQISESAHQDSDTSHQKSTEIYTDLETCLANLAQIFWAFTCGHLS